ncbi:alpha/beta fold hydrolase [Halochromatium glycolicum]|jgi:pimeloyl-ACP methyl ester carboxylesterase|uniref:Alpha/beta hydrolase n=1 Tax=Halochromatium glycolicum TaxID=85075 RepID=A0AAJ0XB86_9GAMM|nr:alpha/beta fold hydrolase [Halochromatium glycolicum]MBK1705667.1 alpha/beta hydrolase [Halochromatium glycolicum]
MQIDFTSLLQEQLSAPFRLALEVRAPWEHGAGIATRPLLSLAPRGDGHPVLVLPLLLGSDLTMQPLRQVLRKQGYAATGWGLGVNLGPRSGTFDACLQRLRDLNLEHGRKVSLVGWSLGGLYARAMALKAPELVRQVISLGTPLRGPVAPAELWRIVQRTSGQPMGLPEEIGPLDQSLPVPASALFSRSDGIVPWRHSLEPTGPQAENIEIISSHFGLGAHPLALYAIADRLAQPEDRWRPFDRTGFSEWLYPRQGRF